MEQHRAQFSLPLMARTLGVSRSGFYDWRGRGDDGPRKRARVALDERMHEVFEAHRSRYGLPRITVELREAGHGHDEKTVAESLRRQCLRARGARKFKATTNSDHNLPVAPNLVEQNFTASGPNRKWVQDITYLATDEGWLYMAVVVDLTHGVRYQTRAAPRREVEYIETHCHRRRRHSALGQVSPVTFEFKNVA